MKSAAQTEKRLTTREIECLNGLAGGLTSDGISRRLGISVPTVAMHISNARRKLNASTREHAVAIALRNALLK